MDVNVQSSSALLENYVCRASATSRRPGSRKLCGRTIMSAWRTSPSEDLRPSQPTLCIPNTAPDVPNVVCCPAQPPSPHDAQERTPPQLEKDDITHAGWVGYRPPPRPELHLGLANPDHRKTVKKKKKKRLNMRHN